MSFAAAFSLAAAAAAALPLARGIELSVDTWDEAAACKTVFVNFMTPWCAGCKAIRPDWDTLTSEYENSSTVLIADVDCDSGGKPLCEAIKIRGYPTLMFGDPYDLRVYRGEKKDLKSLRKFAADLGPLCSPSHVELCDEGTKSLIGEFASLGAEGRRAKIEEMDQAIQDATEEFYSFVEGMQERYKENSIKRDDEVAAIRAQGLGLLKMVESHERRRAPAKGEL